jgi:hypothetical protein
MKIRLVAATGCLLGLAALSGSSEKDVTWTGWFSDFKCAHARAAGGLFTVTNPDCAKSCIQRGEVPVFISEQAQAVFTVKDYKDVIDNLGFHLEVTGAVDESAKTIRVKSVKQLAGDGPACMRPKRAVVHW